MKLSEAIRLGSLLRPQGFGSLATTNGTCALGAALEACGMLINTSDNASYLLWPWLSMERDCPACGRQDQIGYIIASHLNDRHEWTREAIADWVATVEPEEAAIEPEESASQEVVEAAAGNGRNENEAA